MSGDGSKSDTFLKNSGSAGNGALLSCQCSFVEGNPKGMSVNQLQTLDMTRRWSEVRFDKVEVTADALMDAPHRAWPALKRALEWATAYPERVRSAILLATSARSSPQSVAWNAIVAL